ncbi:MAG: hypothetical protein K0B37_01465 [Bacteroidales bacterium]|nr:hypothetical protein [Bacteroidales bacterium]
MQNQQKFLEIINSPYEIDRGTLSFLRKFTETFPYCQSAQVLLAKNLQQLFKPDFEQQVNKASAYAVNRRKFQRFISDRDKPVPETEKPSILSAEILAEEKEKPEHQTFIRDEPGMEPETQAETIVSSPDDQIEKQEKNIIPEDAETTSDISDNKVEETLQESIPEKKDEESGISKPAEKIIAEEKKDKLSLLEIVKKRLLEIQSKNKKPAQNGEKEKQPAKPEIKKEETEVDILVPEKKIPPVHAVDYETQHREKPKHKIPDFIYGKHAKKPDINYLIEKFLKEEPRIQIKKDLPEEQEDLSASSTAEDPQLATETLALVYLKQGKKEEALDVYEKLCLKFPEKSSYFAKKILDIKNEINP